MLVVSAPKMLIEGLITGPGAVAIEGHRITKVLETRPQDGPGHVRLTSGILTPGLIDLHVNGGFGVDFARGSLAGWTRLLRGLAAHGVTSVQPTFITAPLDEMREAGARCATAERQRPADAARVLGAHLEGPFLNPLRRGAHRAERMLAPTEAHLDALLERGSPRTVTLAPELPGALGAIARLARAGVLVSLGHTEATSSQVRRAADAGAAMVTHVFNAQRPLGHREPGVPGAALTDPRLLFSLIVDGHHVHPDVCRLAFAAAPGRVVAVTDAVVTAGLAPGIALEFGGLPVANDDARTARRPDGALAGAGIMLDEGLRRMIGAGVDPAAVFAACTATPARALDRGDIGRLGAGALADLVWWDEAYRPRRVWLDGREISTDGR